MPRIQGWSIFRPPRSTLFIFDDTFFHRSINDVDDVRYCLFMDIVRPNYAQHAFDVAVLGASMIANSLKRAFYKNWSFIR
jgi:beta-hydroxylase